MERVGTLIHKLKEQLDQGTDAATMLVHVRLLMAELQTELQQNPVPVKGKVSVVMPSIVAAVQPESAGVVTAIVTEKEEAVQFLAPHPHEEVHSEEKETAAWPMNMPVEIPTMIHQNIQGSKEVFELNELLVAQYEQPELNERLKEDKVEVATMLQTAPVRDLRKAVGINDRYLFVNELFRGDESMYERSMKTINGFSIYPEAQYWIERELKVKLGWSDQCETARLFDQLVKRRFA